MLRSALLKSEIPGVPLRQGKVRDVYDFGDRLLFVATDRISAFDWVLPNGIPDKGRVLTKLSEMWFARLDVPHHFLTMDLNAVPLPATVDRDVLAGRSMVVKKTDVIPVECVVRGYLSGSGWKEYQKTSSVCGINLPAGLRESERLPEPIFTPATKEQSGHDINISFEQMCEIVGKETASRLRTLSLEVYRRGYEHARRKGVLIADTKFEFGSLRGQLILIDEVLTPDSSRFWPMDAFEPGHGQPSFDKQFVRDWLEQSGWDKNSAPPALPEDIIEKTRGKYLEAYTRLVGEPFATA
jgi:phosphoribosylaminoimidazole-succinocarboxamide synthase